MSNTVSYMSWLGSPEAEAEEPLGLRENEDVVFDYGPDWRAYDEEERRRRARAGGIVTPMLSDFGVGTEFNEKDYRKAQAFKTLYHLCQHYSVPRHVCEEAGRILHILFKPYAKLGCKPRPEPVNAALYALYLACLKHGHYIVTEIEDEARKAVAPCWFNFNVLARLGVVVGSEATARMVMAWLSKIARELGMPSHVEGFAFRLYLRYRARLQGSRSRTIAAMVAYVAYKLLEDEITQEKIARIVGINEASVRHALKRLGVTVRWVYNGITLTRWSYGEPSGLPATKTLCYNYNIYECRVTPDKIELKPDEIVVHIG